MILKNFEIIFCTADQRLITTQSALLKYSETVEKLTAYQNYTGRVQIYLPHITSIVLSALLTWAGYHQDDFFGIGNVISLHTLIVPEWDQELFDNLSENCIFGLASAAEYFKMNGLIAVISKYMSNWMTQQNCKYFHMGAVAQQGQMVDNYSGGMFNQYMSHQSQRIIKDPVSNDMPRNFNPGYDGSKFSGTHSSTKTTTLTQIESFKKILNEIRNKCAKQIQDDINRRKAYEDSIKTETRSPSTAVAKLPESEQIPDIVLKALKECKSNDLTAEEMYWYACIAVGSRLYAEQVESNLNVFTKIDHTNFAEVVHNLVSHLENNIKFNLKNFQPPMSGNNSEPVKKHFPKNLLQKPSDSAGCFDGYRRMNRPVSQIIKDYSDPLISNFKTLNLGSQKYDSATYTENSGSEYSKSAADSRSGDGV